MHVDSEEVERLGKKTKPDQGGRAGKQVGLAAELGGLSLSGWVKSFSC
jgi:hypothetical protein